MTGSPEPTKNAGQNLSSEHPAWAAASPSQDPSDAARHGNSSAKGSRPWPVVGVLGGFALGLLVNALSDAFPGAFLSTATFEESARWVLSSAPRHARRVITRRS